MQPVARFAKIKANFCFFWYEIHFFHMFGALVNHFARDILICDLNLDMYDEQLHNKFIFV